MGFLVGVPFHILVFHAQLQYYAVRSLVCIKCTASLILVVFVDFSVHLI